MGVRVFISRAFSLSIISSFALPSKEISISYNPCIPVFRTVDFDKDGIFGNKGKLNLDLLQKIFDFGRLFYETPIPKSGDPAYYHKNDILQELGHYPFNIKTGECTRFIKCTLKWRTNYEVKSI